MDKNKIQLFLFAHTRGDSRRFFASNTLVRFFSLLVVLTLISDVNFRSRVDLDSESAQQYARHSRGRDLRLEEEKRTLARDGWERGRGSEIGSRRSNGKNGGGGEGGGGSIAHAHTKRIARAIARWTSSRASRAPETQFPPLVARRKKCVRACRSDPIRSGRQSRDTPWDREDTCRVSVR